eukprot:6231724-Pyramimonas_sp.AAC.1
MPTWGKTPWMSPVLRVFGTSKSRGPASGSPRIELHSTTACNETKGTPRRSAPGRARALIHLAR